MIKLFLESVLVLLFLITLLGGIVEVSYNIKYGRTTHGFYWIIPSIIAAIFWFVHNNPMW